MITLVEKIILSDAAVAARKQYRKERRANMTERQRRDRAEYMREYRAKNRERIRQHQADFWERKAQEMNRA